MIWLHKGQGFGDFSFHACKLSMLTEKIRLNFSNKYIDLSQLMKFFRFSRDNTHIITNNFVSLVDEN